MRCMINIPVFCFGGDKVIRDEMRLSRPNRCCERDEVADQLPVFLEQFG
jgi:hypothetical protein